MKRYPHLVAFRVIQPIADAIAELAERDCTSPADTCRRLILAGLRANGIQIGAKAEMPLEPEPSFCPPHLETTPKKRGRPPKRTDGPTFALTVRMDSDLRRDLRRLADDETARRGVVVSLNDLMLEAAAAASARGGSPHERH